MGETLKEDEIGLSSIATGAPSWAEVARRPGKKKFDPPEIYRDLSRALDSLAEDAGRDPSSILRASSISLSEPWDQVRATIDALEKVGVSYLVCWWPTEGYERLEHFTTHILPQYATGGPSLPRP